MFKRFSLIFILLLVLTPVSMIAAQDTTELSLWVFVDRHGIFMENQAERWNEVNPDRPIEISYEQIEYNQMHDNLLLSLVSGTGAPDLVDIEISKFATYTKGDIQLLPLDDAIEPYREEIIETRLAPYSFEGHNYGIDYHLGAFIMYYNQDILEAAGVDVDSIVTWDDYIAAGLQVTQDTDGDGTPDIHMMSIETADVFTARGMMLLMGGGLYDADGNLILDSPENVAALQFIQDLVYVHGIATPAAGGHHHQAEHFQSLINGDIASLYMPQWYMTRFVDDMGSALADQVVVRPMPIFEEGGITTTMGGGTGTAITNQIDPDKVELAQEFLAFAKLTYDGNVALWTDLGFDPMRLDVYDDPALLEPNPDFSGEVPFEFIRASLGNVAPEYTGSQYPEIADIIRATLMFDLIENQASPEEVIADTISELEALAG